MKRIKRKVAGYLSDYIPYLSSKDIQDLLEIPPPDVNFTYAFPCFKLTEFIKKEPNIIAETLVNEFELPDFIEKISANEAYINIQLSSNWVLRNVSSLGSDYGNMYKSDIKPLTIVIEYPSPNTNKPLHLGHVRNMLIGLSVSNLLKYKGHNVFRVNLNNDRGIHICKSMLAYKKWGDNKIPEKKSDHFVGDFYTKYNQEEDEDLKQKVQQMLKLWEEENIEIRNLWSKLNNWALNGFKETYDKLGITFDKEYFESEFYWKGKQVVINGLEQSIFEKNDGSIVANLKEDYNLPDKILLRSDGTSIYITQDIYLAFLKEKDFEPDLSIYIVGNEQDLYFKQLFAVLGLLGFNSDKLHLSYGMIKLPEGKMKSRAGNSVDADNIINDLEQLAYIEVDKRYSNIDEEEKLRRSEIIAQASIIFFILKYNAKSEFTFNPKDVISFDGETGLYIQYCYARIQSILSKSLIQPDLNINFELLTHEKELNIINILSYFPEVLNAAVDNYNIHLIPQYLLSLSQAFSAFYSQCQVISEDKKLEKARLLLIMCVQTVIKIGMNLMGIKTLNKM